MSASKAHEKVSGEFVACVVGQSRGPEELFSAHKGIGKSCLCYRFVYPGFDDYIDNHESIFALHEFESHVINNDHFLYWGSIVKHFRIRGSRTLHTPVRVHVIEQTVFYQDETSKPFPKSDRYVKRIVGSIDSPGKGSYRSRNELDSSTDVQQYPAKINKLARGYMVVIDVSQEGSDFEAQLQRTEELLEYLAKNKQKYIIIATKRDISHSHSLRRAHELRSKYHTTLIETSAGGNINVRDAFRLLAHKVFKKSPEISDSITSFDEAHENSLKARWQVKRAFQLFLKDEVTDSEDKLQCIQERKEFQNCKKLTGMFDTGWLFATHILELRNEAYSSSNSSDTRQEYLQKFVMKRSDLSTYSQHLKSWIEFVAGEDETDHIEIQEKVNDADNLTAGQSPQCDASTRYMRESTPENRPNASKVVDETCADVNNAISGCKSGFSDKGTLECGLTAVSEERAQHCLTTGHSTVDSSSMATNSESESSIGDNKHSYVDMDHNYEIIDYDEEDVSQDQLRSHVAARLNVQKPPPKTHTIHNSPRQSNAKQASSDADGGGHFGYDNRYVIPKREEIEYGIFKMSNQSSTHFQKPTKDDVQHLSAKKSPSGHQGPTTEHDRALKSINPVSGKYEDVEYGPKQHKKPRTAHLQKSHNPAKPTEQAGALKPSLAMHSQQQPTATSQSLAFSDGVGAGHENGNFVEIKVTNKPAPYPRQALTKRGSSDGGPGRHKCENKRFNFVNQPFEHEEDGHHTISSQSRPVTHEVMHISRSVPSQMNTFKERSDFSRLDSPRTLRRKLSDSAKEGTTSPVKCYPSAGPLAPSSTSNTSSLAESSTSDRWRKASLEFDEDYINTALPSLSSRPDTTETQRDSVTSSSPEHYVDEDYVNTAFASLSPHGTPRTPTGGENDGINRVSGSLTRTNDEEDELYYDYPDFRTQRLVFSPHHDSVTDSAKSNTKQMPRLPSAANTKNNERINKGESFNSSHPTVTAKSNSRTLSPRVSTTSPDEDYIDGYVNTQCSRQLPSRVVVTSKPQECDTLSLETFSKDDEMDYDYPDIYRCFAFLFVSQQKINQQMAKRLPRRGIESTSVGLTSSQSTPEDSTTRHGHTNPPLPSWWLQLTQGRTPPFVQSRGGDGRENLSNNAQARLLPPRNILQASRQYQNFSTSQSGVLMASTMSDYYVPMASAPCTLDDTYINWETIYSNKDLLQPAHSKVLPPRAGSGKDASVPLRLYSVDDTMVKYQNTLPAHNHKSLHNRKLSRPLSTAQRKVLPPKSGKDTSVPRELFSVDDTEVEYLNVQPPQKSPQQLASQVKPLKCPQLPPKELPQLQQPKHPQQMTLQDPPQCKPKPSHQISHQQPVQASISKPPDLPPQQPLSPHNSPRSPLPLMHQQPPQRSPQLSPRQLEEQSQKQLVQQRPPRRRPQSPKQQSPVQLQKEMLREPPQKPMQRPQRTSQQRSQQHPQYIPPEQPTKPSSKLPLQQNLEQPPQQLPDQPTKVPQSSRRQSPPVPLQHPLQQLTQSLPQLPIAVKPHEEVKRTELRSDTMKQSSHAVSQPKRPQLHPKPRALTTSQPNEVMSHTKQPDVKLKPRPQSITNEGLSQPNIPEVKPKVKPKPKPKPKPSAALSSKPPKTTGSFSSEDCRMEIENTSGLEENKQVVPSFHPEKVVHAAENKSKPVIPARTFTRLSSPSSTTNPGDSVPSI